MAWVFGQATSSTSSSSGSLAYVNLCISGSLFVACARTSSGTPTGFSDSVNGAWTAVVSTVDTDGNTLTYGYFIGNTSVGKPVVQLDGSSLGNIYISIAEYTFTASSPTLQVSNTSENDIGTNVNSGSVTIPGGEMIAIGMGALGSGRDITAGGTGGTWALRSDATIHRAIIQDILDAGSGSSESIPTLVGTSYSIGAIIVIGAVAGPTGTGAPAAQAASAAGVGERIVDGTGIPAAQAAVLVSAGVIGRSGSGAPAAQVSAVVGAGGVSGNITLALTVAANQELKDAAGTVWASLANIVWEWYDTPGSTAGEPVASGTFSTNVTGEATIVVNSSGLANGSYGQLILYHPSNADIRATLRVPVVK